MSVGLAGVFNTLFPAADGSQSSQALGGFSLLNFNLFQMPQQMQQQQQPPSEHQSLFSSSLLTPFPGMQSSTTSMPYPSRAGSNPPGLLSTSLATSNGQAQQQQLDQAEVSMPAGSQQLTPSLDPQLPIPPKRLPPVQPQRAPSAPPQACYFPQSCLFQKMPDIAGFHQSHCYSFKAHACSSSTAYVDLPNASK